MASGNFDSLGHSLPPVSVIVPVFNAPPYSIETLFGALIAQDYPSELLDVIFVDNGSTDDSYQRLTRLARTTKLNTQVELEKSRIGSYAARNKGIRAAGGQILAFTDVDCVPESTWIGECVRALVSCGRDTLLGGRVELRPERTESPTAVEMFDMVFGFSQEDNVRNRKFSVTANLVTWREVFRSAGEFDENLRSKGDYEWCQRAQAAGNRLIFCPSATVQHPARRSLRQLVVKTRRVAGGQVVLKSVSGVGAPAATAGGRTPSILSQVRRVWLSRKVRGVTGRLLVSGIALLVFTVSLIEKGRLALGGQPERR